MATIQTMVAGVRVSREIATKWEGEFLFVHRPMKYNEKTETAEESRADKFWQITHKKSGKDM